MLFPPYAHVYWPFAGAADAIVHPLVDGQICRP